MIAFVLFGGLGLALLIGGGVLGVNAGSAARHWLDQARGPWALPLSVIAFALLAFLGVPQFALIAAAVAVFGPWRGMAYSWTGTLGSALLGFWLGRAFGARMIGAGQQGLVGRIKRILERNGFIASLVVRLVPFAPFVLINAAAGLTSISPFAFALGTGIGIVPKIALTAFAGASVLRGGGAPLWLAGAAMAVWIAGGFAARRWMNRSEGHAPGSSANASPRGTSLP